MFANIKGIGVNAVYKCDGLVLFSPILHGMLYILAKARVIV